jgi:hypothetical protein
VKHGHVLLIEFPDAFVRGRPKTAAGPNALRRASPATALPSTLVRANVVKQRLKKYSMRAYLYAAFI